MLYAAKHCWIPATLCFTLASTFRSNGIVLSGYIIWGLVFEPILHRKTVCPLFLLFIIYNSKSSLLQISFISIIYAALLTAIIFSPFIHHNYRAYILFCGQGLSAPLPEWCHQHLPSIYTHAQSKYWDVGFLRYWTPSQIPNFLIAIPPLALLIVFSVYHVIWGLLPYLCFQLLEYTSPSTSVKPSFATSPFLTPTIIPHVLHTLFLSVTLLFFSHTQIILRFAAALPTVYWAAAWLLVSRVENKKWGVLWVWWSAVWGLMTLGLWVAFLPPA